MLLSHECSSQCFQFCHYKYAETLIEGSAHTQPLLVGAPVEGVDWLCRQGHVLHQAQGPCHAHLHLIAVLHHTIDRVVAVIQTQRTQLYSFTRSLTNKSTSAEFLVCFSFQRPEMPLKIGENVV